MGENGAVSNPYAPPSPDRQDAGGDRTGGPQAGPPQPGRPGPRGPVPPPRPPHPPVAPPPPPSPEVLARTGRLVRHFSTWLLAGVVVGLLPLPWRFAAVAFLVGAVVAGVRALRAIGAARLRGSLLPLVTAGLVLTTILLVGSLGSLVTWRVETERQTCLGAALTRSAQAACEREYQEGLDELTGGLTGLGRTTPTP